MAKGLNNREIARQLFISENTVKNHVRNILEKLQLHSRMEAVMYAVKEKLLDLPDRDTGPRCSSLSRAQARRVALARPGFPRPRATRAPTMRTFARTLERTGVLQVDSVNVLQRAHFMPLYSRMGPYDVDLLRRAAEQRPRRVVEYWAHVQALMPVELWPVMQHRMEAYRAERRQVVGLAVDPETLEDLVAAARPSIGASAARATAR